MDDAEFIKTVAIEFAKYLMEQKVSKARSIDDVEEYLPKEYSLMRGNLEIKGEELYNQFLNEWTKYLTKSLQTLLSNTTLIEKKLN